jgi:HK97 family phage major capsid protein
MAESTQETIRTMKLGTGEYIWRPGLSEGAPNTLFGKPVAIDDFMPVIASGAFPIAYGNFKRAYLILNRQGIRVLRNPYATMGKVGFYTTRRIGGGVVNYEAYKVLKIAA